MATSVYPATGGFSDTTTQANFIPELWSDEIRAAYEKRLVMAGLVKRLPMVGKKGDTIHIPAPTRGSATAKAAKTAVTVQANTESEVQVLINKHYEYSKLMEDVAEIQALADMRGFYTDDAGYALATQTDVDLHNEGSFRGLIKLLDDNSVPFDERYFVIPPSLRKTLMGIDRYVSSDFVDGRGVQNGKIGNLYGIDIYVTANCSVTETAAQNSAGGELKAATLFHKEAFILAEQQNIRAQTQYKQEWLGTLFTADTIYGVKTYRPDAAFNMVVNA